MQAVLMAGGKGTRLRPFTTILPKPLVPVGEIPILEMVLRQLRFYGFDRVCISVGHKAELVMAVIGDGKRLGLDVSYYHETQPLGTIGSLACIDDLEENFLVMNGDICTNLDFGEFLRAHVASGALATVSTFARREQIELGLVKVDGPDGKVVAFHEKPTYDFLVSMGVNAFQKTIRNLIPPARAFGFDALMLAMLDCGLDVRSRTFGGVWHDIGRVDDYDRMLQDFRDNPTVFLPEGA